jgi:hypothetical protein
MRRGAGLQPYPPTPFKIEIKKKQFVDMMVSVVLHYLPLSDNQPLKYADD